jgi:hypothetical protein
MRGGDETPYSLQPRQHDVSYQRVSRSRKRNVACHPHGAARVACAPLVLLSLVRPTRPDPCVCVWWGTDACLSQATLLRGRSYINSLRLL